ncbi:MAG: glycosyltransferase family 4 protein [Bacteroidota bacterium]|nr:glycosyltransferase family 4 protein [Bacteroidota bacterium]MDE2956983.1 glycosyltransferase family 4 protein [Bacteroidota bacterium]
MAQRLHIVGRFPPPRDGQTIFTQCLSDLLRDEFDVRNFSTSHLGTDLQPKGAARIGGTALHYLRLQPRLRQALADLAPVIWCSISSQMLGHWRDLMTVVPCFNPGQKIVASIHWGNFSNVFARHLTGPTARRLMRRIDRYVIQSASLAETLTDWIPADKLRVIPNYVPPCATKKDLSAKVQSDAAGRSLRVLYLSNMIAEKGYLDVLEAVALARQQGLVVEADFAGRWNSQTDADAFAGRIKALGLGGLVRAHGPIADRQRVQALFLAADVFVLPTYYPVEAQPMTIIEALSAGTPVIVTRHASIEEMVREGREALFVAPKCPEEIVQALRTLIQRNTWRAFSGQARQRYENHFGESIVRKKWTDLIAEL